MSEIDETPVPAPTPDDTLPVVLKDTGVYHFADPFLQEKFDHALDSVPEGASEVEFDFHLSKPTTGLEAGAYIVGAHNLGAGFSVKEIVGVKWRQDSGTVDPEAAFQIRWSNAG